MLKTFSRVQMLSIGEEVARKASESGFVLKIQIFNFCKVIVFLNIFKAIMGILSLVCY